MPPTYLSSPTYSTTGLPQHQQQLEEPAPLVHTPPGETTPSGLDQSAGYTTTGVQDLVEQPPRKRQRTEELSLESDLSQFASASSSMTQHDSKDKADEMAVVVHEGSHCIRDEKYYLPEGDCVIRVQDTLFKVHRFILSRDSSAFEHMFTVSDQGDGAGTSAAEGGSDQRPMMLYGETAANFRLLLSILYALPADIQQFSTSNADIPTLLAIAEMTNKYSFVTTAAWAISCLHIVFRDGTITNQWNPFLCRSSLFRRIIEVAILCGHQELCDFAVNNWIDRILNRTANPLVAIAVADKFGLVKLQGVSYYVALLESGPDFEWNEDNFGAPEPDDELTPVIDCPSQPNSQQRRPLQLTHAQKSRLLSGFFALVHLWEELRAKAPSFPRPDGCTYHAHGCLSTWQSAWNNASKNDPVLKLPPADVVGRLKQMQEMLMSDGDLAFSLTPVCRRAAMGSVKELVRRVQDSLAGYFKDLSGCQSEEGGMEVATT